MSEIRQQLDELNRQKGDVIRELEAIEKRFGIQNGDTDAARAVLDRFDELEAENEALGEQMQELIDEADEDIDDRDYEHM